MTKKKPNKVKEAFAKPREIADDNAAPPPPPPPPPEAPEPPEAICAQFPLNDTGNSRRLLQHFGEDLMYIPRVGWFVWTGKYWKKDDDELAVRKLTQTVSDLILEEIPHLNPLPWQQDLLNTELQTRTRIREIEKKPLASRSPDEAREWSELGQVLKAIDEVKAAMKTRRQSHKRHAKAAGNTNSIKNMMTEAETRISRRLEEVDADPLAVCTDSGILVFRVDEADADEGMSRTATFELVPHSRDYLCTKIIPVEFDPKSKCPGFEAFLERIMPDKERRLFLQRWFGLSMTALTGDQKMCFFYGVGSNGKSVLVDLMARILSGYATTAKIESLIGSNKRSGDAATPDLVPLMGARMVRASEPEQGERMKEGMIKELTGGEPILIRSLHQNFVEVKPFFKLTISGNHKPEIRGTDDGIWRRLLMIMFDVQIPAEERDRDLGRRLWEDERTGILNWLVDGLISYMEIGLSEPASVTNATQEYREESDYVHVFLNECCEATGEPGDFTQSRELVEAFNYWMRERGETQWRERTFTTKLKDKAGRWTDPRTKMQFEPGKRSRHGYSGLKFTDVFRHRWDTADTESKWGKSKRDDRA